MKSIKTTVLIVLALSTSAGTFLACDKVDLKNPIPTVACYNTDKEAPAAGEPITFDASCSSTDADSYDWDFGDSTRATGIKATHLYETPGEYTVKLKVVGGGPAETTKTITIK